MAGNIPLLIRLAPSCNVLSRTNSYKLYIIIFTFLCYTSFHLSRKPISIVKSVLHQKNCSIPLYPGAPVYNPNSTECDWGPFDHSDFAILLGSLDNAYLAAYAIGMFFSGHLAERMNLRYFVSGGMLLSGIFTAAFGLGYFFNIHYFWYYIVIQIVGGLVQSSGWPSVVTCMGNWYGKGKRGLIMGIWNSHTSVGNILGSLIAGIWVDHAWGWSFVVPGIIIGSIGVIAFLTLVPEPSIVDCELPQQQLKKEATINEVQTEPAEVDELRFDAINSGSVSVNESTGLLTGQKGAPDKAISFLRALLIPGVIEFSLCLFCAKLVSYTFLFWLPKYISVETDYSAKTSGDLSTLFDVGGILGGIVAGVISDYTGARASTCCLMLILAAPMMYIYNVFGSVNLSHSIGLLLVCGFMVNGPYALITTAVSADLGTHKSLQGNTKALATVTAIIDGTGSIGAAIGPLLTGVISPHGWNKVFYMLITADLVAMVFLARLVYKEIKSKIRPTQTVIEVNS